MDITLDSHGNAKQKECFTTWNDNSVDDIVYGGSKSSGKSFTGVSLIFADALSLPQTSYFIARKELNDLRKFTIPSINEVLTMWGITSKLYRFNGQDNYYDLRNGSMVYLVQARYLPSDPEYQRFGSMQMTRGWIEEAGEVDRMAKESLSASVGRWKNDVYGINGKILQTCNPSKNYLYKEYYKPYKLGELAQNKRFIQALPTDNKMLQKGYLEHLERTLSGAQKKRLLFGEWEYDDDPAALCDYERIVAIFDNDHVKGAGKFLTADIARMGSDKAIIMIWEGWKVIEYHVWDKSLTTEIQNAINALRQKHGIPKTNCVADEDGVGGGVVDNCKIMGFVNNASPLDRGIYRDGKKVHDNYRNLQSQCCYLLAEKIQEHAIYIQCEMQEREKDDIIEELEQLKSYQADTDGKLKILPKEKIKDNIGRSPDWRDTLMMRAYFELKQGTARYGFGSA